MEEIDPPKTRSWSRFIVVGGSLAALAIALIVMTVLLLNHHTSTHERQVLLVRLAVGCLALLCLVVVALIWAIYRFLVAPLRAPTPPTHTEHVDAWALAGKRFKLEDHPELDPAKQEEEGEEEDEDETNRR